MNLLSKSSLHSIYILILAFILNACTFQATKTENEKTTPTEESDSSDKTAPDISSVNLNDGSNTMDLSTSPTFSWSEASDVESGISHYEVSLGTTPGGTEAQSWINIGLVTSYQFTGVSLTPGETYYLNLRAVDSAGNASSVAQGDGFQVLACNSSLTNDFGGGDGTLASPYRICSLSQWNHFANTSSSWDKYIKLESDLDFTGIVYADFKSIGNITTAFTGNFDGNNLTIKNITLNGTANNIALFLNTNGNATIKNLNLLDINLTSTGSLSGLVFTHGSTGTLTLDHISMINLTFSKTGGGLVHTSNGPLVAQNISMNNVLIGGGAYGGGIAGRIYENATFSDISISNITCNSSGNHKGAVLGNKASTATTKTITFQNINLTNMAISGLNSYKGGLAGSIYDANVTALNCNTAGSIDGSSFMGGLVGYMEIGSSIGSTLDISQSSFNGTMDSSGSAGGLVGIAAISSLTISNSFSKGSIDVWGSTGGGLVGQITTSSPSTISNSYSQTVLTDTHPTTGLVGGIVGTLDSSTVNIDKSYFSGSLISPWNRGCAVGSISTGSLTLTNVYYDSTRCTANTLSTGAHAGGTGLATGSFQTATPFTNWLIAAWTFASGVDPKLIWEP